MWYCINDESLVMDDVEPESYEWSVENELWEKYGGKYTRGKLWEVIDGKFTLLMTEEDIEEKNRTKEKIQDLKAYLDSTDYIVTKISEAQAIYPETVSELINHYRKELDERVMARDEIRRLEKLVSESTE